MTNSEIASNLVGSAVLLQEVTKVFSLGDGSTLRAADNITLELPHSGWTSLTGPSGSGKSTLLHLIGSIDEPDSGEIIVAGTDLTKLNRKERADYRSRIGFVFQRFHLLPALTVMDNVLAPLAARKVTFDRRARAGDLLEMVGLSGREHSLPAQLSGGQQQRVAIARALINEPYLLLADEPTGNLDSATADGILDLIDSIHSELGSTVIMATHDPNVAMRADRCIHIKDGKLDSTP